MEKFEDFFRQDGSFDTEAFESRAHAAREELAQRISGERLDLTHGLSGGVYFLIKNSTVLYIGETACFIQRLASHYAEKRIPFNRVEALVENDAVKRIALEQELISLMQPEYNGRTRYSSTTRNYANRFKSDDYESTFNKSVIIDSEFDE